MTGRHAGVQARLIGTCWTHGFVVLWQISGPVGENRWRFVAAPAPIYFTSVILRVTD